MTSTQSSRPHTAPRWPVGFTIRPGVDPESGRVELNDTVTGKRFSWRPEALAGYILASSQAPGELSGAGDAFARILADGADRAGLVPGWQHWQEREWHPSDQYYVASRRFDYVDTADADGALRTDALAAYLREEEPVTEYLPEGPVVALGEPAEPTERSVAELLTNRRSGRAYVPKPVRLAHLSGLLWHGFAEVRGRRERTDPASPLSYLESFGSAWDVYLVIYNVEGVEAGVYRYDMLAHELIGVRPGDHREAMIDVLQGMHSPATAAWTLALVADFPRYQWRYRHEHGLRRLYFEVGIIGQELIVLGSSYGLSTLVTPAQKDRPFLDLIRLSDRRYAATYTLTQGYSRGMAGADFNGNSINQRAAREW